ncbi:MAG: PTS transporter subunit EIIC [Candidatus Eremiobacteraeota bacterium]|nr:PTS transporter subunit EIIC [Candidatus Eremiobacteraeota bacterium]
MSPLLDASKPSSGNSKPAQGFFGWFDRRVVPPMRRFGEMPAMIAIREALPWSLIGLAAGIVLFFLASYQSGAPHMTLAKRYAGSLLPGFGLMSVTLAAILPLKLAQRLLISPFILVPTTLLAFFLSPPSVAMTDLGAYLRGVGASGLFLAIMLALISAGIFLAVRRLFARLTADLVAPTLVLLLVLVALFAHLSLSNAIVALIHPLGLLGDTYLALIVITCVETLLWTAGVHGPALLAGIITPVYLVLQQQNTTAYYEHTALPHIVVVSLFLFIFPGGAGATLPLVLMLFFSRIERLRKIARLTLVPSIFNINEPLLFGLPVVLNPFLAVPFVVAPAVLATITYAAVATGLVARPAFYYPSSIPSLISVFLATLDWRSVVLMVVNIVIASLIYFPFVKAYERHEAAA